MLYSKNLFLLGLKGSYSYTVKTKVLNSFGAWYKFFKMRVILQWLEQHRSTQGHMEILSLKHEANKI